VSHESVRASLLGQLDAITSPQGAMDFQRRWPVSYSAQSRIKTLMLTGTGTCCA
jgi:hypothetical protein